MSWLAWRQFRAQAALAAAATTAVVVTLVLTRDRLARVAGTDDISTWLDSLQLLGTALIGLPAFIGAFWGAPLIARELETGTHHLVWTQGVTRGRWLATKLATGAVAAVVIAGLFSATFTWWSVSLDQFGNRIGTANFGQRGVAPIAYALFALALGTLMGAVIRRTLPAMAATLAGFFVVRFTFQWVVRPRLMAPVLASRPSNEFGVQDGPSALDGWALSSHTVDAAGRPVHDVYAGEFGRQMARVCGITIDSGSTEGERIGCINRLGLTDIVRLHPDSHFWGLQIRESVIFTLLALTLAAVSFWWISRRIS
jgi:ABC-2 family transporter